MAAPELVHGNLLERPYSTALGDVEFREQHLDAGEIWEAHSREGAERGEAVVVIGREGLTLLVERAAQ